MVSFTIVPVLDLKGGHVVHARAGERARYLPIRSNLASGSEPGAVLDGILSLAPFRCIYIADLDAIERRGSHRALLAELSRRYRGVEFWIDGGFASATEASEIASSRITPVLGSESLRHESEVAEATARMGAAGWLLSLDYRGDQFVGPPAIEAQPDHWPERVIAMTLSRVGSAVGPDLARLAALQRIAGTRRLFAAGGVRGPNDLDELAAMGLAGVLVASALHDGRLMAVALSRFKTN